MQPHHNYSFRASDSDKLISQFGRKPSREMRDKILTNLKGQRQNFKSARQQSSELSTRMDQIKAKMQKRSRGRSV
ncbi:hypothetical protein [Cerasicoccus arenae]|uniref:Uncharacterized protein n=1 Tax=Cerasicoccus arenae TaxID=424488 RepID=A0A8J3GF22_9BACT|nr:hypothetical protein [Cerasicoccus arenae]MBK1860035.1 hypothetical protein [Cerasicoccus arenae]GHC13891.1 hypothetical protein GCM10007047_33980 [Cerasicoccus arenae]